MTPELASPFSHLAVFTFGYVLCLLSPGPNVMAIAGVALARGFRSAMPVSAGVAMGSLALGVAVAAAADAMPDSEAWVRTSKALGAFLLLYVAWRLLTKEPPKPRPQIRAADFSMGFTTAFANPITGAYFASQFIAAPIQATPGRYVAIFAVIAAVGLVRSLVVAALCGHAALRDSKWISALHLRRISGAAFAIVALWMLATEVIDAPARDLAASVAF